MSKRNRDKRVWRLQAHIRQQQQMLRPEQLVLQLNAPQQAIDAITETIRQFTTTHEVKRKEGQPVVIEAWGTPIQMQMFREFAAYLGAQPYENLTEEQKSLFHASERPYERSRPMEVGE